MDETFVIVSHDMEFVRDVCDRCMFVRGGKITRIGPTHDVLVALTTIEKDIMARAIATEWKRAQDNIPKSMPTQTNPKGEDSPEQNAGTLHASTDEMFEM
jgi:methyl coenzyme M reductase system subunit A2